MCWRSSECSRRLRPVLILPFPTKTKLAPAVRIAVSYSHDVSVDIAIVKHGDGRIMQKLEALRTVPAGTPTRSKFPHQALKYYRDNLLPPAARFREISLISSRSPAAWLTRITLSEYCPSVNSLIRIPRLVRALFELNCYYFVPE